MPTFKSCLKTTCHLLECQAACAQWQVVDSVEQDGTHQKVLQSNLERIRQRELMVWDFAHSSLLNKEENN